MTISWYYIIISLIFTPQWCEELCFVHKSFYGELKQTMTNPNGPTGVPNGQQINVIKCKILVKYHQMSWNVVKCQLSNVMNCQMSSNVKCHQMSNVIKCLKTPEFGWCNMWTAPIFNVSMPPYSRCSCKLKTSVCTPEARLPHWQLAPPKVACLAPINPTVKKSPNQAFAGEKSKSTTLWRKKSLCVIALNIFR